MNFSMLQRSKIAASGQTFAHCQKSPAFYFGNRGISLRFSGLESSMNLNPHPALNLNK
jgi:hypothetical protein